SRLYLCQTPSILKTAKLGISFTRCRYRNQAAHRYQTSRCRLKCTHRSCRTLAIASRYFSLSIAHRFQTLSLVLTRRAALFFEAPISLGRITTVADSHPVARSDTTELHSRHSGLWAAGMAQDLRSGSPQNASAQR